MIRKLTSQGFIKQKCPTDLWEIINDAFQRGLEVDEYSKDDNTGLDYWIKSETNTVASGKIEYSGIDKENIIKLIKPHLEKFANSPLKDGIVYHIRRYRDGANLKMHKDNAPTHHVGANITIDVDGEPWPFQIVDHEGVTHEVFINPMEVVFYEASRLEHGRPTPFQGNRFTNTFIHFKLDE